jgi:hypothetical protein
MGFTTPPSGWLVFGRAVVRKGEVISEGGCAQVLFDEIEVGGLTACRMRREALPCVGRRRTPRRLEQSCHPPLAAAERAALRASAPRSGSNPSRHWTEVLDDFCG